MKVYLVRRGLRRVHAYAASAWLAYLAACRYWGVSKNYPPKAVWVKVVQVPKVHHPNEPAIGFLPKPPLRREWLWLRLG